MVYTLFIWYILSDLIDNPISYYGFKLLIECLDILNYYNNDDKCNEIDLSNTLIDDKCVMLLTDKLGSIKGCEIVNLSLNDISCGGLKSICEKSLENRYYPFIRIKSFTKKQENATNDADDDDKVQDYLNYYIKRRNPDRSISHDLSSMI